MGKRKPPKQATQPLEQQSQVRLSWVGLAAPAAVLGVLLAGRRLGADDEPPDPTRVTAASLAPDGEGDMEIYRYDESFRGPWAARDADESYRADACSRTDDWYGVPMSTSMAVEGEVDWVALREHLLVKEQEWMQLPIRDWKDTSGSAYNSTSARYDQYNVLSDRDSVPAVGALYRYIKRTVHAYLRCFASRRRYFDNQTDEGRYFAPISERVPPMPLYIMCWVNIYRAGEGSANAIHWHIHHWSFQGYVSVNSESSATLFRSNVQTGRRWQFDHATGMQFVLPGGTLHSSTPWRRDDSPRITVAFNVAPPPFARPQDGKFVWVELFSAEELARMRARQEQWAMIVRRPPIPYTPCMYRGAGVCADGQASRETPG